MISSRPAASLDDLRSAERILSDAWLAEAPMVASHPGDLEWWDALTAPTPLADHLRLWHAGAGDPMAWSWVREGQVHWEIRHDRPADADGLLDAILTDAIAATTGALHAWAAEGDPATSAALDRHGFVAESIRLSQFQQRLDRRRPIDSVAVPDGYRIRPVQGPGEIPARVAVHRAAFAPSRMTVEHYERMTTLPHYAFEDDLVVEAPDGTLAAFAMAWWDPIARVGEFEPVGTHPDHQRRGLGRALLTHGLRGYLEAGATTVQVYSQADNEASEGLYQAVGFTRRRFRRRFERPADGVRSEP